MKIETDKPPFAQVIYYTNTSMIWLATNKLQVWSAPVNFPKHY